jgi:outer membrane protein assembly factor BamB
MHFPGKTCLLLPIILIAAHATAASWPMFRGGQALLGVAEGKLPSKMRLLWSFKTGAPVKSSAAIEGGRVFIGSDDGNLYALKFSDGAKLWEFKTGRLVQSSPLALAGNVFVGSGDDYLYALDAASGNLLWKYQTGEKILGAPNWVALPAQSNGGATGRSAVLVGSYDFKLHCVDAQSGKPVWTFESGNYINGSPAVSEGKAVFGGCDAVLHVISLAEGKQESEVDAGAYVAGSVALADGRAYFGQFENEFLCVDLKKQTNAWAFRDRNFPYFSSPAVSADRVVFGGRDKILHCVNRSDGHPLWSFPTRGKVDSSPVICGDKVVVGSDDGRVYVVSLQKGNEIWSYEIGRPVGSSPAVADGKIVIGADDGTVYCFGEERS